MKKLVLLCLMVVFTGTAPFITGCAGRRTTTETTTEVRRDPENLETSGYDGRPSVEVTKKEEVTQEDGHKGFFGIVGDIIALPFRAIGSIL